MPALVSGRSLSALLLAFCAALSGCGSFDGASLRMTEAITPYKVEVVQGNFVASEQLQMLKAGLTHAQVRDLLGTPMITSIFHGERWDYAFTLRRKGVQTQSRRLTVYFKGDAVDHFDSDPLPTEADFVASLDVGRKVAQEPVLEVAPDALKAFAVPAPAPIKDTALPLLPASYPPLEEPRR
jgi:outer membrane protein assembly factor BamE